VWLKGNAHEKFALAIHRVPHQPDFSHGGQAPCVPVGVTNVHGTIGPERKPFDAASLAVYLIVIAAAAIVILIHPKPDLIPLLLWYAGHPL